jgi:hypothetical protein
MSVPVTVRGLTLTSVTDSLAADSDQRPMQLPFDACFFLNIAVVVCGAIIARPAASQNLIPDPTFAGGTVAGWQPLAATSTVLTWDPDSRDPGSGSLAFNPSSPGVGGVFLCVSAAAGQAYAWRGSTRGTPGFGLFSRVDFFAGTGCSGTPVGGDGRPGFSFQVAEWSDLEFILSTSPINAPPSTVNAKLTLAGVGPAIVKVDNLYFGPPGGPVLSVEVPGLSSASRLFLVACLGLSGVLALGVLGRGRP